MVLRPLSIILLISCLGCRPTPDLAAERAAVSALFDRMSIMLCAGDWAGYQTTWAHESSVEHLDAGSDNWVTGWERLSQMYQAMMPAIRGCRFELTTFRVQVSQDATMAWAVSKGQLHMADTAGTPVTLWGAFGFEKRAGVWQMVMDHSGVRIARDSAGKH